MAELIIDRNYYNKLDIEGFSKMMSSPSYCYKFYWLEAIVQLISANRTEATYDEIINKMIVNAWLPVQEYHIHLSGIYGEGEVKDNHEKPGLQKLYKHCYKDNLHSIWAVQELYRKGNSPTEFINILGKNMQPVYDSARRQGYEIWKVS